MKFHVAFALGAIPRNAEGDVAADDPRLSEQRVIRDLLQEMKRNNATLRDLWATHKKLVENQS